MTGTMTWGGLDVHARSTHAAAINTMTDACRRDLMTARHRVSKMLLRHGLVYPETVDLDAGASPRGSHDSSSPRAPAS